ncbi:MAG: flagellar biosynthetic protein FliR [Bryobacterales bacterium]|nr:flagellar biosynthetic protein FliR [Bryobacterales bacterium]
MFDSTLVLRFLLVLARVGSVLVFVPIPGAKSMPQMTRVVFVLALTVALYPVWPVLPESRLTGGQFAAWMAGEAVVGVGLGLIVAFIAEVFAIATQMIGLQAGFSYASTVDPGSEADSPVISVLAQLGANLLFFALGLERVVLKTFVRSLEVWPPGHVAGSMEGLVSAVVKHSSSMIELGVRLALPIAGFLVLLDLTLALLGRLQSQLQLLTLALPLKMLAALVLLAILLPVFVRMYGSAIQSATASIATFLGA